MAGSSTNINNLPVAKLKAQADGLLNERGMSISKAFDISLNQPNKETIVAMLEAERIAKDSSEKGYTSLNELFADFEK